MTAFLPPGAFETKCVSGCECAAAAHGLDGAAGADFGEGGAGAVVLAQRLKHHGRQSRL